MVDFGLAAIVTENDDKLKGTPGSMAYFAPEMVSTGTDK